MPCYLRLETRGEKQSEQNILNMMHLPAAEEVRKRLSTLQRKATDENASAYRELWKSCSETV